MARKMTDEQIREVVTRALFSEGATAQELSAIVDDLLDVLEALTVQDRCLMTNKISLSNAERAGNAHQVAKYQRYTSNDRKRLFDMFAALRRSFKDHRQEEQEDLDKCGT